MREDLIAAGYLLEGESLSDEELLARWDSYFGKFKSTAQPVLDECCICYESSDVRYKSDSCSHSNTCVKCWSMILYTAYINGSTPSCPYCRQEVKAIERVE